MYLGPWTWNFPLAGFSFVSGALSRGSCNWSRLLSIYLSFLMYILVFDAVFLPWLWGLPYGRSVFVERVVNGSPSIAWYLQSLMVWKSLAWFSQFLASGLGAPRWLCFTTMSLALFVASAFIAMHFWSLDYGVAFLPSFAIGLFFPVEELIASIPMTPIVQFSGCCCCVLWSLVGSQFGITKDLHLNLTSRGCISVLSWCEGLWTPLLDVTIFIALLALACPRQEYWFTKIGKNSAMYVYLLHWPAICIIVNHQHRYQELLAMLGASSALTTLIAIVVPFALVVILSSRPVKLLFSLVIEPYQCLVALYTYHEEKV